jgi:peroxiredoxin
MRLAHRLAAATLLSLLAMSNSVAAPPKEGDPAPDVRLKATQVKKAVPDAKDDTLSLADLKGKKKVVLFYFPKALTRG